jgi:fumarate hydratase class II
MGAIMVKEAKFFRKQAERAETAARASSDAEVSESLHAMALGYRNQAALIKKKKKAKPKAKKATKKARPARKKSKSKRRP